MSTVKTIQGDAPLYRFPTGPMVLGEAPIYRASDSTLHLVDCIKEPAELHIVQLDPKSGDVVGKPKVHVLEDSVTVQFFRKGKPKSCGCSLSLSIGFDRCMLKLWKFDARHLRILSRSRVPR